MTTDPSTPTELPGDDAPPHAAPGAGDAVPGVGGGDAARFSRNLTIQNKLGLHARPCGKFVKISNRFRAEIWVEKDGEEVNGKSILSLMMLAAGQGSKLRITAEGPDARQAIHELEILVQNRFDEE